MLSFALYSLEKAINQYLRLDPQCLKKLAKLKGKLIEIDITDWHTVFYVRPARDGLHLLIEPHAKPDTIIKGKLFALIRVGYEGANSRSLFANKITIHGDTETGETLREVLQKIDVDWEEHLSRLTSDHVAHNLSFRLKQITQFGEQTLNRLKANIKEYLHFEAAYLPTADQIEALYENINRLRNDVERLEARIQRLQKGAPQKKGK